MAREIVQSSLQDRSVLLKNCQTLQATIKHAHSMIADFFNLQQECKVAEQERYDQEIASAVAGTARKGEEKLAALTATMAELKRQHENSLGQVKALVEQAEGAEKDKNLLETRIETLQSSLSSLHGHAQELKIQKRVSCKLLSRHEMVNEDLIALSSVLSSASLHAHDGLITAANRGEDAQRGGGRVSAWYAVCGKAIGTQVPILWRFRAAVIAVIAANRVRRLAGYPYLGIAVSCQPSGRGDSGSGGGLGGGGGDSGALWKEMPLVSLLRSGLEELHNRDLHSGLTTGTITGRTERGQNPMDEGEKGLKRGEEKIEQRRPLVDLSTILPGSMYMRRSKMRFSLPIIIVRRGVLSLSQRLRSTSRKLFYKDSKLDEAASLNATLATQQSALRDKLANKENVISILESRIEKLNSEALQNVVSLGVGVGVGGWGGALTVKVGGGGGGENVQTPISYD